MVRSLTQICTFKLLKPCKSISGEFDLTKMLLKSSFNVTMHNHTQVLKCRKQSQNMDALFFSHPPYSPDLAPSDLSLFGVLKDATLGRFGSEEEVI
jgi:hypothetical protein